jgi:hypothetical protein
MIGVIIHFTFAVIFSCWNRLDGRSFSQIFDKCSEWKHRALLKFPRSRGEALCAEG